jgi:hypothetical protein
MAEHPSEAVVAKGLREYLSIRLTEATRVLYQDSSRLVQVPIEIMELATGEGKLLGGVLCRAGRLEKIAQGLNLGQSKRLSSAFTGYSGGGVSDDTKGIKERGEPSIFGAGSSGQEGIKRLWRPQ